MNLELAAVLISLAALVVGFWSTVTVRGFGREQNRLQSRMLQLETAREHDRLAAAQRAALTAALHMKGKSAVLTIRNTGPAAASKVQIELNGTPIATSRLVSDAAQSTEILAPGASLEYRLISYDGMPSSYHVSLGWQDESGPGGNWSSDLTVAR